MTISEIKSLEASELISVAIEVEKHLFELKLKHVTKQAVKTHQFKQYRHMLAQLLTEQNKLKFRRKT